jgi:electron transport complex protein RnfG
MTNVEALTAPRRKSTPSAKLLFTLTAAGVLSGILIVGVYRLTLPSIEANRTARLESAIIEVVPHAQVSKPLYLYQSRLVDTLPPTVDARHIERIYVATADSGKRIGYAIPTSDPGFADDVRLIFGFDSSSGEVLGMKILESRETPGLGDKTEKDPEFAAGFHGVHAPLRGVKKGTKHDSGDVDVITGATISSRTVIRAINKGVARWSPLITAWEKGAR